MKPVAESQNTHKAMEPPLVSVVVAVYNMESTIGRCIESLLEVDYPRKEIIIVDDGSTDDTPRIVSRYPVKYISKENEGVASARNLGIEHARGEIIAFTDGDCYVEKHWLRALVEKFGDGVGGVGGEVVFMTADPLTTAISIEYRDRFKGRRGDTKSIACINAAFRREVFQRVGGFKRVLGESVGGEDIEFSYRVIEAGYKLRYEPGARVYHDHQTMSSAFLKRNYRNAVVSVANFFKHRSALRDRFFNWTLITQPLLFAVLLVVGLLSILYSKLLIWFYLLLALAVLWNIPLALKTCRETSNYSSLPYLIAILFLRGVVLSVGMGVGLAKLAKELIK
jgi:glycosyltransferase involved in cell wall biosynthesis